MTCETARDLLLTADPAELKGEAASSPLSAHLRGCEACRLAAGVILNATRELAAALESDGNTVAVTIGRRRGHWARLAVPLAAAAGLTALLLGRGHGPRAPTTAPPPAFRPDLTITAPPGRNVAVLHTDDPHIVVIWFY